MSSSLSQKQEQEPAPVPASAAERERERAEELLRLFTWGTNTFKLVACDMDGTLLGKDHKLSSRTIRALQAAASQGVTVLLATGRMVNGVREHLEVLGTPGIVVAHNGALVKDVLTDRIYHHQTVAFPVAEHVLKLAAEAGGIVHWNCDDEIYYTEPNRLSSKFSLELGVPLHPVDTFREVADEPTSLLVMGTREQLEPVLRQTKQFYSGQFDYVFIPWFDEIWQLQFLPSQTSKGNGVLAVASLLGIQPDEIVSFGDSYNDLEMITSTGLGIAMGNAVPELKQAAKFITLPHDEDGVAVALEVLFHL